MIKNIRIWYDERKHAEALWLYYFFEMTGFNVWKCDINEKNPYSEKSSSYQDIQRRNKWEYIDIAILSNSTEITMDFINNINCSSTYLVTCGKYPYFLSSRIEQSEVSYLDINNSDTFVYLMQIISKLSINSQGGFEDRISFINLAEIYTKEDNLLFQCVYIIKEIFYSFHIDYTKYEESHLIYRFIDVLKKTAQLIHSLCYKNPSYENLFAYIYLENVINIGCLKNKEDKSYNTLKLYTDSNYLVHNYGNSAKNGEASYLLKLSILQTAINLPEQLEDILVEIKQCVPPEYHDKAFGIVGSIYRKQDNSRFESHIDDVYDLNREDAENILYLYQYGIVLKNRAKRNSIWYENVAIENKNVSSLISRMNSKYWTPLQYEYYCKAVYWELKSLSISSHIDISCYKEQLDFVREKCNSFKSNYVAKRIFGDTKPYNKIILFTQKRLNELLDCIDSLL